MSRTHHCSCEVSDVGIIVVVIDVERLVHRAQITSFVGFGATQHFDNEHRLCCFYTVWILLQKRFDSSVSQRNVKKRIHQPRDTLGAPESFKKLILALLNIFPRHFHPHHEASGDISTGRLQRKQSIADIPRLGPAINHCHADDTQHAIEMVIRNVPIVMHWTNIRHIVGGRSPKITRHKLQQLLFHRGHFGLVLLEKAADADVHQRLRIHRIHHGANSNFPSQPLKDGLR
mmetsp:Transcript_49954/g.109131  ORF Transcript_49954/g.109131 Transcript_49954/m.109131 type:complete len:231 (-) Transcript_49954:1909-2601(-)